ncbi:hypothetical protein [Solirubrum puertoriconensis]|nr:hypothetical protein [Solirubrum puertoriconensis]
MKALLTTDATGASTPKMSYIDLLNRFWQLDGERKFGASATRLYFFLVQECNRLRWTNPFVLSDKQLCLVLGMTLNTMKAARAELVERGVVAFQGGGNGRGDATVYALQNGHQVAPLKVSAKVSKFDTYSAEKVSEKVSISDTIPGEKVSAKVSKIDTYIYKEDKTKTSSVVEDEDKVERAPVEKKMEQSAPPTDQAGAALLPPVATAPLAPAEPLPTWLRRPITDFSPALALPFDTDTFRDSWVLWRRFLLEQGKPYRGDISEQEAMLTLGRHAAGNEAKAVAIIKQSIGREWTGFYPLKSDDATRKPGGSAARVSTADRYRAPHNDDYGDL